MADLWAALCLVLILEGLLLFASPAAWKAAVAQLLALPDRHVRSLGGAMLIAGLLALYALRGG